MKKQSPLLGILLFLTLNCWSQEEKTNPILFTEITLGYAGGSSNGLATGLNLNYQIDNHLITARYMNVVEFKTDWFFYFPIASSTIEEADDYGLLYGRRKTYGNYSLSYSAGVSYMKTRELIAEDDENDIRVYSTDSGVGLPFEFNIKWFNSQKERYRIYGIIPVGKPISFSRSIGFKFFGTVSKSTFMGLGITYGFGWHKNY